MAGIALAGLILAAVPGSAGAAGPPRPSMGGVQQVATRLHHDPALSTALARVRRIAASVRATRPARVAALHPNGASLCVGSGPGCFAGIQAALDAAHDGDTVKVGPGTYAGGITISKSIALVGAGARSTVIRGGGSVVTIGTFGAAVEPMVAITGVTITGGIARSSPESVPFVGVDGVLAFGGGIEIPPNGDFSGGADVTIKDSVIAGNRVAPAHAVPSGFPCPSGICPFAAAAGGGIDNWGTLRLVGTTVSDNRVGSASGLSTIASDANAGGIMSWQGPLILTDSAVDGNRASATSPNGRFADSGGIFVAGGSLTISRSSVTGNSARLAASLPDTVDLAALAGGVHVGVHVPATIRDSRIIGNAVSMSNSVGSSNAFSGGLHTETDITASGIVVSDNTVTSSAPELAVGDSGAGEMGGTFSGAILSNNTVSVTATNGWAIALGGAGIFLGSLTGSVVTGNHVSASSPGGGVWVVGGALVGDVGGISLRDSTVSRNAARGSGSTGSVRGGGIFDAVTDGPPGGPLGLNRSSVIWNVASGSAGVTAEGGGIFTDNVVTMANSVIAHNLPDQCVGC